MIRNLGVLLAVCLLASPAWAGENLSVQILSPGAGECVNNGDEVFVGGILGGEAQPDPRDVPVRLRLSNPGGGDLSVTFTANGIEVQNERFIFPGGNAVAEADFFLGAFNIFDSPRVDFEVIVVPLDNPDANARDTVVFELDRRPPVLRVDLNDIDALPVCPAQAPEIQYEAVNSFDPIEEPDPTLQVEVREEITGCIRSQIFTVRDTCGNAQEYELNTTIPADPGAISARLQGYRCGVDGLCNTGEDAPTFDAEDRLGRGTVVFELDAPPGCIDGLDAVLMTAEDFVEECPAIEDLEPDENGVIDNPCPFLIPGNAIEEPGDYVARLVVSSCGEELIRDELPFTIVSRPTADAGGPYAGGQGELIQLDASGSNAPEEIGGIVAVAWDLNGDGFFDSGELGDDINGDGVQQAGWEFDRANDGFDLNVDENGNGQIDLLEVFPVDGQIPLTPVFFDDDGLRIIRMRITAGNGAEELAEAEVDVVDVDPDCQIGGPYEAFEGEPIQFDASASSAGHPSDPIIAWNWDFGDDVRPQRGDDLPRPNHIYRDAGEFTVTLGLEDIDSTAVCETIVTVQEVVPIVENLELEEDEVREGDAVIVGAGDSRAGSVSDPIVDYAWEARRLDGQGPPFGQQNGPLLREPEFVFDDQGSYEICLTVTDDDGDEARGCVQLEVLDISPTAVCAGPADAVEGTEVQFSGEGSLAGGPADPITRIEWDFGDELPPFSPEDLGALDAYLATRTFAQNGVYEITLTVFDEDDSDSCTLELRVEDTRPSPQLQVLYPAGRQTGTEGEPLEFDASGTEAGADEIAAYRWDFGDGETDVTQEPFTTHTFADDGNYQVTLTVVDADGSRETVDVVVEIDNRPPTVELVASEAQVELGQQVDFVTVVDGNVPPNDNPQIAVLVDDVAADLPPRVVEWDFGDGTPAEAELLTDHRFNALGEFTITVYVEDAAGGVAEAEITIEVTAPAPRIENLQAQEGREGLELAFDVAIEAPPLADELAILQVNIPGQPPGAEIEIDVPEEGGDGVVRFRWTPTFYQAGRYTLQIRAAALQVPRSDRTRTINIVIEEGGTPRLAAVGGSSGRGVLTIFDYGRDDFRAVAEVELGLGGAGLAAQADGRRVFVAVPGSNRVAVVRTAGQLIGTPVRRIPVGRMPTTVVRGSVDGAEYMFSVNMASNDLSVIDAETLKVVATSDLAPMDGPSDAVWLPDGFDGLQGPKLAVVSRRSGHIALVDAAAAVAGDDAIEALAETGGVLTRVVASAETGWLYVADAKARRVYRLAASSVDEPDAIDGASITFAARDLVWQGSTLYVATGDALLAVDDDGEVSVADGLLEAQALTTADDQILGGGALVVASPTRIENLAPGNLGRLRSAGSSRVRRLAAFVARE